MCGRFTLFADYEQILERFDVDVAFGEENSHINAYNKTCRAAALVQ